MQQGTGSTDIGTDTAQGDGRKEHGEGSIGVLMSVIESDDGIIAFFRNK
jgi:hypothetical protein